MTDRLAQMKIPAAVWLMLLVVATIVFYAGVRTGGFDIPLERIPWSILVPCFALFSFTHSIILLGWQRALVLLVLCLAISFLFEFVGEATGAIFGPYRYTELLGVKLFGRIPLMIPFAWYMMFYPSYVVTNMLAESHPVSVKGGAVWTAWMSALSALIMTAWDLTMDPIMSYHACATSALECISGPLDEFNVGHPAWVWLVPGLHFGVPALNYWGWFVTSFVVFFIFRTVEPRLPHQPWPGAMSKLMVFLPIGAYGSLAFIDAWLGYPEIDDIHLITPFAMGIPFLFASFQLFAGRADLALWPRGSAAS